MQGSHWKQRGQLTRSGRTTGLERPPLTWKILASLVGALAVACGGSAPEPRAAADEAPAAVEPTPNEEAAHETPVEEESAQAGGIPERCSSNADPCVPPWSWVQKLCADVHPETALYLFRQGTPWKRMYLTRKTEAINASGGASIAGYLEFDEEVLVLRHQGGDPNGIQVGSGGGSYDALRWDGSCVSLDGAELTDDVPPQPKHSRVEWRWLGEAMRNALRRDEALSELYRERRSECKAANSGRVTKQCERLDAKLIARIVEYVRNTSDLPTPEERIE